MSSAPCPACGAAPPAVGVLCRDCAALVPPVDSLLPEHVSSGAAIDQAAAWLVDGFGAPHALAAGPSLVGRRPPADLLLLNASVSREHAELSGQGGWQVRDLGSRNGTFLAGQRIAGRAALAHGAVIRFGDVGLLFVDRPIALLRPDLGSIATGHAADSGAFRVVLRGEARELCLVGQRSAEPGEATGGSLLHRAIGESAWQELSLPPLEFQLLRILCENSLADSDSPAKSRGCVPTRQLVRALPFQSRYANEENVRQVVRRLRATLGEIGAAGLVEAQPGRGYHLTWPVASSPRSP
jgi:hypothetical protein